MLDRNPVNYFAEVEQAAFEPKSIVPGMGHHLSKADPAYGAGLARGLGLGG